MGKHCGNSKVKFQWQCQCARSPPSTEYCQYNIDIMTLDQDSAVQTHPFRVNKPFKKYWDHSWATCRFQRICSSRPAQFLDNLLNIFGWAQIPSPSSVIVCHFIYFGNKIHIKITNRVWLDHKIRVNSFQNGK